MVLINQNPGGRVVFTNMVLPVARTKEDCGCGKHSAGCCIHLLCTFSGVMLAEMSAGGWCFRWSCLSQWRVWKYHPPRKRTEGDLRQAMAAAVLWLETRWLCLPALGLPSMNTVFHIFFQSYKISCCFKLFSLLYYFTVPVCGEFTTAKSSSYKNATIREGDFSVNSNQTNWTYCSMQYWKPAIRNFLKELRITAKTIRNCSE